MVDLIVKVAKHAALTLGIFLLMAALVVILLGGKGQRLVAQCSSCAGGGCSGGNCSGAGNGFFAPPAVARPPVFFKAKRKAPKRPPRLIQKKQKGCDCQGSGCKCGNKCGCGPQNRCAPDCPCLSASEPDVVNFGLDVDKMTTGADGEKKDAKPRYWLNGKKIDRARAHQALAEADVPADASKRRLTLIGSDADCQKVLTDLKTATALAPWKDSLVVQAYPPTTPLMSGFGFQTTGAPSIYCQAANGEVLFRNQDGTYPGPDKLAAALRRTDPAYDPKKDPDITPPSPGIPSLPFDPASVPPVAYGLGAVAAFLLLKRGQSS